jgi:hypothetical protein
MSASADTSFYVVSTNYNNFTGQFGTLDVTTDTFNQIGPVVSDPLSGLAMGPNGNLLSISASGNLDSIDPATGAVSVIGATGLGGLAYTTAELNGTLYATDLNNNLYSVNTTTGVATLIGPTGIPPCPSLTNPDDVSDETLFASGGNLYATFDGIDLVTSALVDSPELYQIDPTTGVATLVGPTALGLDAAVSSNGTVDGFDFDYTGSQNTVLSIDPANGSTSFLANYPTSPVGAFDIEGAAPTPEPSSLLLFGSGLVSLAGLLRRKRLLRNDGGSHA